MKTFQEWLESAHPECLLDEGILDTLGKSKLLRGAVTAAGLAAGAIRGMPKSSAAGIPIAPGVVQYDGEEGNRAVDRETRASNLAAERGDLDVEQRMLVRRGPENWMVTDPSRAPDWYKPYLYVWYRNQLVKIEAAKRGAGAQAKDDLSWIKRARMDTSEVRHHTFLIDGREVQIDEPLKNPEKLLSRVSEDYRAPLMMFYQSKIDDLGEEVGLKAYRMGLVR